MIERASEFGASAAVPLVAGERDSTHMTAGDMLREAREAHGLHLEMVAAALKVSPQKLAALENDEICYAFVAQELRGGDPAGAGADDRHFIVRVTHR